jgi:hypothetical protein
VSASTYPPARRIGWPATEHWEVRPALRTADFFEIAYSGNAGPDFYERFADEFRLTKS